MRHLCRLLFKPLFHVRSFYLSANPSLDAWHGAQKWSMQAAQTSFAGFTTKQDYEECGLDYLSENSISNRYYGNPRELELNPKFNPGRGRQSNIGPKINLET